MSRDVKVNKATLELKLAYLSSIAPNNKSLLYPLTTKWKASEVTFANADQDTPWGYDFTGIFGSDITGGGDFDRDYKVTSSNHMMKDSWITFDVTDIVKEMVKSPDKFHGFVIAEAFITKNGKAEDKDYDDAGSYNNHRYYYSSDNEEKGNRPRLKLDITPDAVIQQKIQSKKSVLVSSTAKALTLSNNRETELSLELFSIQGRVVSSMTLHAGQSETLNTTNFAKGIYLLKISNQSDTQTQHVVIK